MIRFAAYLVRMLFLVVGAVMWLLLHALRFAGRLFLGLLALITWYAVAAAWPVRAIMGEEDTPFPSLYNPFTDEWRDNISSWNRPDGPILAWNVIVGWWLNTLACPFMFGVLLFVHSHRVFMGCLTDLRRMRGKKEETLLSTLIVGSSSAMASDYGIGEIFYQDGVPLVCEQRDREDDCAGCWFTEHGGCHTVACVSRTRKDRRNIRVVLSRTTAITENPETAVVGGVME